MKDFANDTPAGSAMSLEERRHQMTLEALRELDEGKFIEHEEIVAWIASLKDEDCNSYENRSDV